MVKTSQILSMVCGVLLVGTTIAQQKKSYIVHLVPTESTTKRDQIGRRTDVDSSLQAAAVDPAAVIYTYSETMNGFAASLTDSQVQALNSQDNVLSVTEDKALKLHTTRSPGFLGLADSQSLLGRRSPDYSSMSLANGQRNADEANIIIAVLDTGAWPENPSYDDTGMPDIPAHWKGSCEEGQDWTTANCNKKLIGAAAFYKGYVAAVESDTGMPFNWTDEIQSPRDSEGHGTHTSTTAGGSLSPGANLFGEASGTARGMAPDARLAIYKICWVLGCFTSDILAGMDKAIADGVNVISGSFGGPPGFGGAEDSVSIGAFAAMEKGIFTSFSAGNSGPSSFTVSNSAPWVLGVAASTIDRDFPATVLLGNGKNYTGVSLYVNGSNTDVPELPSTQYLPLILASKAGSNATNAELCLEGSLDPALVTGKIVVCIRGQNGRAEKGSIVKAAGGRGMVLINPAASGEEIIADAHVLPAVHLGVTVGAGVLEYVKSGNATAALDFEGTRLGISAPKMAAFSSRGPNAPIPQLMKPDLTGPGVDILAGWTPLAGPTSTAFDHRKVDYNIISGTSMSCPHLSGIAAYVMARRPDWSVAAIRSALMTTTYTTTKGSTSPLIDAASSTPATPFDYGNGHVDPIAALDPGLIYDIAATDYLDFLCSVNSSSTFIAETTRTNFTCDTYKTYSAYDLNYPSFAAYYDTSVTTGTYTAKFPRTVTNVASGPGVYAVAVSVADSSLVDVTVEPETLTFTASGEKQTFMVTVSMTPQSIAAGDSKTSHGRLVWSDGVHNVGSSLGFIWG